MLWHSFPVHHPFHQHLFCKDVWMKFAELLPPVPRPKPTMLRSSLFICFVVHFKSAVGELETLSPSVKKYSPKGPQWKTNFFFIDDESHVLVKTVLPWKSGQEPLFLSFVYFLQKNPKLLRSVLGVPASWTSWTRFRQGHGHSPRFRETISHCAVQSSSLS